jgi:N-acetylglutamate synthase-like GNAT family acetyltransferase
VFITRATRHDMADLAELLEEHDWGDVRLDEGVAFVARDGGIAGCVRLVEVAPQTVVVDDMLVHTDRRREGIGSSLLRAAMNSRGGTLYLCCHDDVIPFYERFGFSTVNQEELPGEVVAYFEKGGEIPAPHGEHFFMRAR